MKIAKVEKLLANLHHKEQYVPHKKFNRDIKLGIGIEKGALKLIKKLG